MGNLLKVASLGLFAAMGIAAAVSVATHLQPVADPTEVARTNSLATEPNPGISLRGGLTPVLLHDVRTSPDSAVSSPATIWPSTPTDDGRPISPADESSAAPAPGFSQNGFSHLDHASPAFSNPPRANPSPLTPGPATTAPLVAPPLAAPIEPPATSAPESATRAAATMPTGPPVPEAPDQPLQSLVAAYQPLVSAQFDFSRDSINKIEATQEKNAALMAKLQDDQNRPLPSLEVVPPAPADTPPLDKPQVTMNDDKLTLIFQDSEIKTVLSAIGTEAGLNILTSESVEGLVSATLTDVEIQTALDAVLKSRGLVSRREGNIVYVGTHEELHFVQHGGDIIKTRVYRPNYITALDMQALLTPLLSKSTGQLTISTASEVGIASDATNAGGDSFAGEEVVVVRDFEGVLAQIDQLVAEVDRMPRQVAIEAMILSVTLDDKNELGVDFELLRQKDALRITSGTPLIDLATAPFTDGLKIGFLDSSVFLFLNALETIGDTNVVASPRVMCLNKQRAEILIGSELGYVSTTITETAATQSVEFLEVGTQLSIRPFISSEGMVRMEVHPELSTGTVRVAGGFTLPDKEVTQVTTNVMCPDGATVVIGGLIREDLVTSSTQIPLLGNLPWVGPVFRQRREDIDRREIIVLLTPRIVKEEEVWTEGKELARQFQERQSVFQDKMDPLGKRHFGERYRRKATAAWAAGDADTALRYCNLAIHFDPLHSGAIELRGEILAANPNLEVSVHEHLRRGLAPPHLPHHDYSKEGYPWRLPELPNGVLMTPESEEISLPPLRTIDIGPPPATGAIEIEIE